MPYAADYGVLSLLPIALVVLVACIWKRAIPSLILGALAGFALLVGRQAAATHSGSWLLGVLSAYLTALYAVIGESAWFLVLFGLFGVFVRLLEDSGLAEGFSRLTGRLVRGPRSAGLALWLFGVLFFIDNYFSILANGLVMRRLALRSGVSRELLTFSLNGVASAVCIVVPLSAWAAFMAGQLSASGLATGSGMALYVQSIPYMVYAWLLLLTVALCHSSRLRLSWFRQKAAAENIDAGLFESRLPESRLPEARLPEADQLGGGEVAGGRLAGGQIGTNQKSGQHYAIRFKKVIFLSGFIVPLLVLVLASLQTGDLVISLLLAIAAFIVLNCFSRERQAASALAASAAAGFKDMLPVMGIVLAAFVLQKANEGLGLAPYVISLVLPRITPALLPALSFVLVGLLAFASGSFWGMAAIAFSVILPLAAQAGISLPLICGAVVSGTAFGSSACYYGDSVNLACSSGGITPVRYSQTALPLLLVVAALTALIFMVLGFLLPPATLFAGL